MNLLKIMIYKKKTASHRKSKNYEFNLLKFKASVFSISYFKDREGNVDCPLEQLYGQFGIPFI